MWASFNNFELNMTKREAAIASHPGHCDSDVAYLLTLPKIKRQLAKITDQQLITELSDYGAWDEQELANRADNEARIIWLAANDISEDIYMKNNG